MLTIKNYTKLLNGAHPEFTCAQAVEKPNHYEFLIDDDTDGMTYTFKLSRKLERDGKNHIITILWDSDRNMEYSYLTKEDMGNYVNLFHIMVGMINEVKGQNQLPF
jgi:hypothetical protein